MDDEPGGFELGSNLDLDDPDRAAPRRPSPGVREVGVSPGVHAPGMATRKALTIDCGDCVMAGSDACDDCIVSFIVNREPGDAVVVDAAEERALRNLSEGGLVPRLRHAARPA